MEMRVGAAFTVFREFCDNWLEVERAYGADAITDCFQQTLAGKMKPNQGCILSMWDAPA
jgi:hypothetical protein